MDTMDALANNLQHVYFFLKSKAMSIAGDSAKTTGAPASSRTEDVHAKHRSSVSLSTTADTIATSPSLSADAPEFVPSPTKPDFASTIPATVPATTAYFEVREVPGKGLGVVATRDIPIGTRILVEPHLLRIPTDQITAAWEQYQALDQAQKDRYDSLCSISTFHEQLEAESRAYLLPSSKGMPEDDFDKLVKESARVLSIFKANGFDLGNGQSGVFATASRFNHSCMPNTFHSYNLNLNRQTVYATWPISAGDELTINYIGQNNYYHTHTQRKEWLREHYNFTCQCPACTEYTGYDDQRRELLYALVWGLHQYATGMNRDTAPEGTRIYIPTDGEDAYQEALDVIQILCDLRVRGPELGLGFRQAAEFAYKAKDWDNALKYAYFEREHELELFGRDAYTFPADEMMEKANKARMEESEETYKNETSKKKKKSRGPKKSPEKTESKPGEGKTGKKGKKNKQQEGSATSQS